MIAAGSGFYGCATATDFHRDSLLQNNHLGRQYNGVSCDCKCFFQEKTFFFEKKTLNNHEPKARVKNLIRNIDKALSTSDVQKAEELFKEFQSVCDDALSKGLIKKNTADREKSRLAQKIKNAK